MVLFTSLLQLMELYLQHQWKAHVLSILCLLYNEIATFSHVLWVYVWFKQIEINCESTDFLFITEIV